MNSSNINDPLFAQAMQTLDAGDTGALAKLIAEHPRLVKERLINGEQGYFKDPYLIWFVADNPIRNSKLSPNVIEITQLLIKAVKREAPGTYQEQIDYTLGLVATGRIPRESGVQIALMDLLIDAGAAPGGEMGAFANENLAAAQHLIDRVGKLTFPAAVCLERMDDIARLAATASPAAKLTALTAAAFYGNTNMVTLLLGMGIDPIDYPDSNSGFHRHATPLHQAVALGSLETVKLLVEAGAKLDAQDKIYQGTPLGWAMYLQSDNDYEEKKKDFASIEAYLRAREKVF